jgi:ribosomal protein S8
VLTKTGGYFVLSTPFGIMNDSDAWYNWIGGTLLFGIF